MDIRKILDVVLPPFREPRREKPRDMIYIAQETPGLYTTFTAGVTLAISALMLVPEPGVGVTEDLKPVLMSPLMMGGFAAIGLNMLFRIGISEQAEIELSGAYAAQQATRFLEDQGANWGARRDVITRAGAAVGEALEALQSADMVRGPVTLRASFDEYQLTLVLDYPGSAFALQAKKKLDLSALLDEEGDDALGAAMSKMSSHLIRHLADTVKSSERADRAELVMQFSH